MKKAISNTVNSFQRYLFVFATVFLVLFSSCAVKTSIMNLPGIPTKTERDVAAGSHNFSSNTLGKCEQLDASTQTVQKVSFNSNDLLPIVIFTAVFLFLLDFRSYRKEKKHPLYSGSTKIRSSIPLFLEYRKLLIHFS